MSDTNKEGNPGFQKFRKKRFARCQDLIDRCFQEKGEVSIIDLGGTRAYWDILAPEDLEAKRISITLVNNEASDDSEDDEHFRYLAGDACAMSEFADNSFDIVHSNSVIEHVGDWSHMEAFAKEARRLAPRYFVQTPNFWFPVEPHYMLPCLHWLPVYLQIMILGRRYGHCSYGESVMAQERIKLLSRKAFVTLFPDAEIIQERICLLTKSFVAIRG